MLGPRSALFAPVVRPRPDRGRRRAGRRLQAGVGRRATTAATSRWCAAEHAGAVALLVSATPSLESRHNAERGKLGRSLRLTDAGRAGRAAGGHPGRPARGGAGAAGRARSHFSERLRDEIDAHARPTATRSILLRNRRGYAPLLLCRACGEDFRCDDCGLPRTFHRRGRPPALPLLRLDARRCRRAARPAARRRSSRSAPAPSGWRRRFARALPGRRGRRARPRHGAPARRPGGDARALRARRDPGAGRHPDGLQGPPLPARRARPPCSPPTATSAFPTSAPSSAPTPCSPRSPAGRGAASGRAGS